MSSRHSHRPNLWSFAPGVAIGLIAGAFFCVQLADLPRQQTAASQLVEHTLGVLDAATVLHADLETITSEARGFILNRSPDMRARFDAAVVSVSNDIAALRALTSDDPRQQRALDRLAALNELRIAILRAITDRYAAGEEAAALMISRAYHGEAARNQIHGVIREIDAEERRLLVLRAQASQIAAQHTSEALIFCGVTIGASLLLLILLVMRERSRRLAGLVLQNAELEMRVASRTTQLAASAARQRSYFDHTPIGKVIMQVQPNGDIVYEDMNAAYAAICGCSRADTIGRSLREVWPAATANAAEQRMLACIASRQRQHYAVRHPVGGSERDLEIDLAPLLDEAGQAHRILVCAQDVTEQRELERQVILDRDRQAEAAEREVALFRNSADILFVVRVDQAACERPFVYESFSPSLEKATGWRAEDLIGLSPDQALPVAAAQVVLDPYHRCLATRTTVSYSTSYDTPFGHREYEGSLTPVQHPTSGDIIRLVGGLRDVTERNMMQEALHHTQKMEAIGRLASGVAHDFNNILQTVCGSLEIMLEDIAEDSGAIAATAGEFAPIALRAARRGAYLTNHLLCYARKQILRPRAVALPSLLGDIEKLLVRTLGPHITVEMKVYGATPFVFADPAQLETALLNLAINASHAMPQGGLLVIEAREEVEGGELWAAITVTDTGSGMDEATLAQAAEPFFTTKGVDGTGLGLSMVQGFAEQSGGRFRIASKAGEGTSVDLRLPASVSAVAEEDQVAPAATELSSAGHILLVDDDPDVLMTVGAFLQKDGFRVIRATGGNQALAVLVTAEHVDAIVTDYAMPGLNGFDLVADARVIRPGLPAVVISGFVNVDCAERIGGTITLHKPFQRHMLIESLRQIIVGRMEDAPACLPQSRMTMINH